MATLLEKIRKTVEESYDILRDSASNVIEKAEDFGKISKLKFEIKQLGTSAEKKLTILGDAVFPHLVKENLDALKDNPAIKLVVDDIQDLNMQIEEKQKEIDNVIEENEKIVQEKEHKKMSEKISILEKEIEQRMEVLKKLRQDSK